MSKKRLFLSKKNKLVAGVCGGIAEYFSIDPTIVRLLWVFLTLVYGTGFLVYLVCMLIIPRES